jgi:hypothetical protein
MYLGILLNYNGVVTNAQKMLSNQGEKLAVFSLFSKIQDDYFNTETLLSLFDTYANSIEPYLHNISRILHPQFSLSFDLKTLDSSISS